MRHFDRSERSGRVFGLFSIVLGGMGLTLTACGGEPPEAPALPPFSEGKPPLKAPPAHVVGGFTIQLPTETLAPGEELNVCYLFPMDIQGPSRVVGGGLLTTSSGMPKAISPRKKRRATGFAPARRTVAGSAAKRGIFSRGALSSLRHPPR
jgi:hypothetical protein